MLSPFGVVAVLHNSLLSPAGSFPAHPNDNFLFIPAGSSDMGDWFMIRYDLLEGGWCFYPLLQIWNLRLGKTCEGHVEQK